MSLTEADEKDDPGTSTANIGSDKCILLFVHALFFSKVLLEISCHFAVAATGSLLSPRMSCFASIGSPLPGTALVSQLTYTVTQKTS